MDKKYKVFISKQAQTSLTEIVSYISNDLSAKEDALKLASLLQDAILSLRSLPERIRILPGKWNQIDLRRMQVKNYYIYFFIDESSHTINILDIIYTKREQNRILQKLSENPDIR